MVGPRYRRSRDWPATAVKAHRAARIGIWLMLLAWIGWFWLMSWAIADYVRLDARMDKWIVLLGLLSVLAIVGGLAATLWNLLQVRRAGRSLWARIWALLLVLAMLLLSYAAVLQGFVDFALKY